jgi:tyrosine decarboxylase / aspartate 1-decarboxylase
MELNMYFETASSSLLIEAIEELSAGFDHLPKFDSEYDFTAIRTILLDIADKMKDNFSYHHPFYLGQMMKPPHPMARLAYSLALWINPNNHALDGGRASSAMEKEAVAAIAEMFEWSSFMGHLTSGGTMANLEALWVAGQLHPGKMILASDQAHYTHKRISAVLQLPFSTIPSDHKGRLNTDQLNKLLDSYEVGTVVVTIGTTATGSVDPLLDVLTLQEQHGFRIHADAAYGGYFKLIDNLDAGTKSVYDHISEVDSIVIDPHKHGLQPYGCGCVLFKDPAVGQLYKHESPYTYFTSNELHLGEISLECSRAGAAAVALWATQKLLPMRKHGEFAKSLSNCRSAALDLFSLLDSDKRFLTVFEPELDIVCWTFAAESTKRSSALTDMFFKLSEQNDLYLAKAQLPKHLFEKYCDKGYVLNSETVTCIRTCLMKPEHKTWMDQIWTKICSILELMNGR